MPEKILGAATIIVVVAIFYFDSWWPLVIALAMPVVFIVIFAVGSQRLLNAGKRKADSDADG